MNLILSAMFFLSLTAAAEAQETFDLREPTALVFDDMGKPVFVAEKGFLLSYAGNSEGKVFGWDRARAMVRISPDGHTPVWVRCADLKPMLSTCTASAHGKVARPRTRAGATRGGPTGSGLGEPSGIGVPNCPGDPRCPKID